MSGAAARTGNFRKYRYVKYVKRGDMRGFKKIKPQSLIAVAKKVMVVSNRKIGMSRR